MRTPQALRKEGGTRVGRRGSPRKTEGCERAKGRREHSCRGRAGLPTFARRSRGRVQLLACAMAALTPAAFAGVRVAAPRSRAARASPRGGALCVRASAGGFIKVLTVEELKAKNGRAVVEVNGKQVLLQELDGVTYAVRGRLGGLPCVLLTPARAGE